MQESCLKHIVFSLVVTGVFDSKLGQVRASPLRTRRPPEAPIIRKTKVENSSVTPPRQLILVDFSLIGRK